MKRPRIPEYDKEDSFDWEYVFELNRYIEHLERQAYINTLQKSSTNKGTVFCGCLDKCYAKRRRYFCLAKRKCVHKIVKS